MFTRLCAMLKSRNGETETWSKSLISASVFKHFLLSLEFSPCVRKDLFHELSQSFGVVPSDSLTPGVSCNLDPLANECRNSKWNPYLSDNS